MHLRLFVFSVLLVSVGSLRAQMLTPFVTAASGGFFTNTSANASLSFTVGEMAMVQTFESTPSGYFLTQGFQQPIMQLVGVDESPYAFEFVVFPNPASDRLNFRYQLQYPGEVTLSWTDMRGMQVLSTWEDQYTGGQVEDGFDTQHISQGMYFLHVSYDVPGKGIHHKSIHKINIIH